MITSYPFSLRAKDNHHKINKTLSLANYPPGADHVQMILLYQETSVAWEAPTKYPI